MTGKILKNSIFCFSSHVPHVLNWRRCDLSLSLSQRSPQSSLWCEDLRRARHASGDGLYFFCVKYNPSPNYTGPSYRLRST